MELREFMRADWDGFAGCEPFADGSDPLIGTVRMVAKVGGGGPEWTDVVIVFDNQGACAMFLNDEHNNYGPWVLENPAMTPANARILAGTIKTKQDIIDLGFVPAQ